MKNIIFDLDGTLSDTIKATAQAIREVGGKYNLPELTDERIRAAMGLADMEFYAFLFPGIQGLGQIGQEIDAIEEDAIRRIKAGMLFPGVAEMLEELHKAGHKLYIASTGNTDHVSATVVSAGIEQYFTKISCNRPEKISMVKELIAGSDKSNWLMVGDMFKDSEAAKGNGITALGAAFGYLKPKDHTLFDAILQKPCDIFTHIVE